MAEAQPTLPCPAKKSGFTLIEMSIVVAIIALITGGILVGQELIRQSQVRAMITQEQRFDAAVDTFIQKYNCLPGDCAQASQFGLGNNGNGDGMIGDDGTGWNNVEYLYFWEHLFNAYLIQDSFVQALAATGDIVAGWNTPSCPVCLTFLYTAGGWPASGYPTSGWLIFNFGSGLAASLTCSNSSPSPYPIVSPGFNWLISVLNGGGIDNINGHQAVALSGQSASAIDSKVDDGLPLTGNFVATGSYYQSSTACSGNTLLWAPSNPTIGGVNASKNQYTTPLSNAPEMNAVWRAGF